MASPSNGTSSEKPPAQKDPSPTADEAEPEPDSLLVLSDDAVRVVIKFLSIADLSTFEVCVRLRRLITPQWDELLADAEKRTGASRPVPRSSSDPNAYCSKLSLMYLLRSADRAVDIEERHLTAEFFTMNKEKRKDIFLECDHDHIFVRISKKAGNSDGDSYRVAWQGFVSKDWHEHKNYNSGILTLPEEASLYDLLSCAETHKEDFNAMKRKVISWSEWREREVAAFAEACENSDNTIIISVIATTIDRGQKGGAIVSEIMFTSSYMVHCINDISRSSFFLMSTSRRREHYDITLWCDENTIKLRFTKSHLLCT